MRVIGHRGAAGHEPENTLRSFQRAIDFDVDMVEFDVQRAKQGLVVIHDDTLERTTNATGAVKDRDWLDFHTWIYAVNNPPKDAGDDLRVPELMRAVEYVIERNTPVNVELKSSGVAKDVAKLMAWMVRRGFPDAQRSIVSSFDLDELRAYQREVPGFHTGVLLDHRPRKLWSLPVVRDAHMIHPDIAIVTEGLVRDAHRRHKEVYAYTVNDDAGFSRAQELGIDGIFTDYPDRARAFFGYRRV